MTTKPWDAGTGPVLGTVNGLRLPRFGRRRPRAGGGARPDAVLFDMDGLLVDSEPVWTVAEVELMDHLGAPFTPALKESMIGTRLDQAVPLMLAAAQAAGGRTMDAVEAGSWLLERMTELFAADLPRKPGARDLLDAVTAAGVPAALVSSSYRRLVDAALDTLGREHFAYTLAGDEVEHAKPHPEPYLTAAAHLGLEPARCVVLEDSLAGATSAVAAGCPCLLVPTFAGTEVPPGVRVVASLREVTVSSLGDLLAR